MGNLIVIVIRLSIIRRKLQWQDTQTVLKPWITQDNYKNNHFNDTSGDTATTYCNELTLTNFSDWRLPDAKELETIDDSLKTVFQNILDTNYWFVDKNNRFTSSKWFVGFYYGSTYITNHRTRYCAVRCVRELKDKKIIKFKRHVHSATCENQDLRVIKRYKQ